jgi:hypothetical protein
LTLTWFGYKFVFMGRAWRIQYEGGLYHVLSRGNERRDIFRDDRDRVAFLDVIGEMADQHHIERQHPGMAVDKTDFGAI